MVKINYITSKIFIDEKSDDVIFYALPCKYDLLGMFWNLKYVYNFNIKNYFI